MKILTEGESGRLTEKDAEDVAFRYQNRGHGRYSWEVWGRHGLKYRCPENKDSFLGMG